MYFLSHIISREAKSKHFVVSFTPLYFSFPFPLLCLPSLSQPVRLKVTATPSILTYQVSLPQDRERRLPSRQTRVGASEDVERWREMEVGVWGQTNKRRTNLQEGEYGTSRTGDGAFDFLRRERNVVNGADVAYRLLVNTRI